MAFYNLFILYSIMHLLIIYTFVIDAVSMFFNIFLHTGLINNSNYICFAFILFGVIK
jgi:hypothetical protein